MRTMRPMKGRSTVISKRKRPWYSLWRAVISGLIRRGKAMPKRRVSRILNVTPFSIGAELEDKGQRAEAFIKDAVGTAMRRGKAPLAEGPVPHVRPALGFEQDRGWNVVAGLRKPESRMQPRQRMRTHSTCSGRA